MITACKERYEAVSEDWNGNLFCGIELNWNYKERTVDLRIPGYIGKLLHKFQHAKLTNLVNKSNDNVEATYGARTKYTEKSTISKNSKNMKS